jgi:broad specificity phosphatase PhoE
MTNTQLYLVRHGQTDWNRQGIFRGLSDVPLNATGEAQAQALGRCFSNIPIRAIHASKLARALQTSRGIARGQGSEKIIYPEDGLADIDRGEWAGLTHQQAQKKYPELYEKWFSAPQEVRFPGGGCLQELMRQARGTVDSITKGASGYRCVVVTHHVVIRALLCSMLDLDLSNFRRFEVFPASVSELRFEYGKWVLCRLNDTCHLGAAAAPTQ